MRDGEGGGPVGRGGQVRRVRMVHTQQGGQPCMDGARLPCAMMAPGRKVGVGGHP